MKTATKPIDPTAIGECLGPCTPNDPDFSDLPMTSPTPQLRATKPAKKAYEQSITMTERPLKPAAKPARRQAVAADPETTFKVPPVVFVDPASGVPDVERHPSVSAAREKFKTLHDQFLATRGERLKVAESLDLDTGYTARDVEVTAGQLIADGKSTDAIDRLEELTKSEGRLRVAAEVAAKEIFPALDAAKRQYTNEFVPAHLLPAKRKVALAWVALIEACREHLAAVGMVKASRLDVGNSGCLFFHTAPLQLDTARVQLKQLVADGTLQPAEVAGLGI